MAEKGNTKQEILETALDLFSVRGYEATSMAQIADAVGIRKLIIDECWMDNIMVFSLLKQEVMIDIFILVVYPNCRGH